MVAVTTFIDLRSSAAAAARAVTISRPERARGCHADRKGARADGDGGARDRRGGGEAHAEDARLVVAVGGVRAARLGRGPARRLACARTAGTRQARLGVGRW
eukprot:CAMPEP_0119427540 /NCGR_PEP_ID=MMETSP1335-20130426/38567_1 /TAXON_ID=259385 /ORGANISM="Chrysoculter rhomboideus, Strain RCC1486" /LENGTH=101 /DNA_ID=CAMNT_0007453179 /DNA_START=90 /DNA_END=392 /DNA_ORIENTATION=-